MTDRASVLARPSPARSVAHAIETVRDFEHFEAAGGMPVEFHPLSRSAPPFTLEGVQRQGIALGRISSRTGFSATPAVRADAISISFITGGVIVRRDHRGEHIGRTGFATMDTFDTRSSAEASPHHTSVSGTVSRATLAAAHLALEGRDSHAPLPRFVPLVDATGLPLLGLKSTMDRVFERLKAGVQDADLVFPLLAEIMVNRLLSAWPREGPEAAQPDTSPSLRPLNRARDFIDGHIAGKLLLSDIAAAAGVGVRQLQTVFKTQTGSTPVQFILERRLDRVRADLQEAAGSGVAVREVAERWGFTHMGDFGSRYRARFGEPPSLTRRSSPSGR